MLKHIKDESVYLDGVIMSFKQLNEAEKGLHARHQGRDR